MKKINRRKFLKTSALGGAALIGGATQIVSGIKDTPSVSAVFPSPETYLPFVINSEEKPVQAGPIIADHTVVDRYQSIPQEYKNLVKKMWANIPGESHSYAYRKGCELLQDMDSSFQVSVTDFSAPEEYTDQYLRINRITWGDVNEPSKWKWEYGEEDWFTSDLAILRTKDHITYCNTHNLTIAAIGFAWCWDMTSDQSEGGIDPFYQVRWAGYSDGGPDGGLHWGLDADDKSLTGNRVCMDTYINATVEYMNHCQSNNYPTKVFFTTGPVENTRNTGESGYQRHIKHEYIREFVKKDNNRILFDYGDILCWSDANQENTQNWTDFGGINRTFQYIHDDNLLDLDGSYTEDGDHIGARGALRLAKALWWMLARIAGWDGK